MTKLNAAKVQGHTKRGKLCNPYELARVVKMSPRGDKFQLLLGQVGLAEERKATSWLRALAKELETLEFHSSEWIQQNVSLANTSSTPVRYETPSDQRSQSDARRRSDQRVEQTRELLGSEELAEQSLSAYGRADKGARSSSSYSADNYSSRLHAKAMPVDLLEGERFALQRSPVSHSACASRPCLNSRSLGDVDMTDIGGNWGGPVEGTYGAKRRHADHTEFRDRADKTPRLSEPWTFLRCPVHGCTVGASLKHALVHHLPGVFNPDLFGDEICQRRLNALKLVTRWLFGAHRDLSDLVKMLESLSPIQSEEKADDVSAQAMRDFLCFLGVTFLPEEYTLKPGGNGVEVLVHWKFLLYMVSMLEEGQQENLKQLYGLSEENDPVPCGFDSHCHLDRTCKKLKLGVSDASLYSLEEHTRLDSHIVKLDGAVGVFSDPNTYPTFEEIQVWVRQGVVPVIGYSPKIPFSEANLTKLKKVLAFPGVAGLGEIGIDRTEDPEKWADQLLMVEKLLNLLLPEHVLVLHCRSLSKLADEAILSMLHLLAAHPYVHREQLIHLHCFTGSPTILQKWIGTFPNTYFGFTAINCDSKQYLETVRLVEPSRLLLETDSPNFTPPRIKISTPLMIGWVAGEIAEVRNMTWTELLKVATANARRLYIEKCPPENSMFNNGLRPGFCYFESN